MQAEANAEVGMMIGIHMVPIGLRGKNFDMILFEMDFCDLAIGTVVSPKENNFQPPIVFQHSGIEIVGNQLWNTVDKFHRLRILAFRLCHQ